MNRTENPSDGNKAAPEQLGRGARLSKQKKNEQHVLKEFRTNFQILTMRGQG